MPLSRFFKDCSASFVPLFALTAVPVVSLVGVAVDYSRANALKAAMQAALDSTALAVSKSAATSSAEQTQIDAAAYFNSLFNHPQAQNVSVTASYSNANGSQVVVSSSADINTMFMGVMGFPKLGVGGSATVSWGSTKLRVALALDNTGSMNSYGKLPALKTATKNLLTTLKNAATKDGDVYVSIIPFNRDVNVKMNSSAVSADWIDWTQWNAKNGTCSKNYSTKSSCVSYGGTWTPKSHDTWTGCVMDRAQNEDTKNTTPVAGTTATMFPAEQYSSCPAAIQSLSYDWAALNTKVDALYATGKTNTTIGLAWAWQSLSEGSPLNPPAIDPNDPIPTKKIIILLTDGENTENRWTTSTSSIDLRTQKACENIKAAGVTLYTVLVMEGNASLLQGCASDATKYFYLTDANQLVTTFDQIGTQLTKLHLSK